MRSADVKNSIYHPLREVITKFKHSHRPFLGRPAVFGYCVPPREEEKNVVSYLRFTQLARYLHKCDADEMGRIITRSVSFEWL